VHRPAKVSAAALLVVGAILLVPGESQTAALASTPPVAITSGDLYVTPCSVSGDGSAKHPLCSLDAAAAAATPGRTIYVEPGNYPSLTLSVAGTATAPITFVAVNTYDAGTVRAGALTVSGSSHVVLRGFDWQADTPVPAIAIQGSTDVTVSDSSVFSTTVAVVTGSSQGVTVTRNIISSARGIGVRADPGVTGLVVSANAIDSALGQTTLAINGVPGAEVVGNTIASRCGTGISLTGGSTGSTIENNIVEPDKSGFVNQVPCPAPGGGAAVALSADSIAAAVVDFNLIDPAGGGPLYGWGSAMYPDVATFQSATGQGPHDLAGPLGLANIRDFPGFGVWAPQPGSPAIDSADTDAPGQSRTDVLDRYAADDPGVTNAGRGRIGYADRGAAERLAPAAMGGASTVRPPGGGPGTTLTTVVYVSPWTADGISAYTLYRPDDSPFPTVTRSLSFQHTFARAGTHCVQTFSSDIGFWGGVGGRTCTVVGVVYQPVAPVRVLDTRSAVGVGTSTPVAANSDLTVPISVPGMPDPADVSGIVLNVTITQPTAGGFLAVYPGNGVLPSTSVENFQPGQTLANLVTVPLGNGTVSFHNGSLGTVHLIADFAGYYSLHGDGFAAVSPVRMLDTRVAIGVPGTSPMPSNSTLTLDLSSRLPAGATAAVLNVTAVSPTALGYLTVFPGGQAMPTVSNLNFTPGAIVPNQVIVAVTDAKIQIFNGSAGSTQVIADLAGYFGGAGATDEFVPVNPIRVLDTRADQSAPVGANQTRGVFVPIPNVCVPVCPLPTAIAVNLTVTQPAAGGFLTAYPLNGTLPNASVLNFAPGQTVPNFVTVAANGGVAVFNGSAGTVHLIADEEGYYIAAP
jgi:hypothetical protein